MPSLTHTPHGRRRWHAIARTFGSAIAAKGVSITCTFLQVPIALHYLGGEGYGLWVTLIGIGIFMNFSDLGLGVGLQNLLSTAFADAQSGDDGARQGSAVRRMREAYATGALCLGLLGLAVVVAAAIALPWVDWAGVFNIKDPVLASEVRTCLGLTVAAFALGFPLNATARLLAALQTGWIHGLWIAVGSVVALGLTWIAVWLSLPVTGFIALSVSAPLIQGIGMHVHAMRRLGWRHGQLSLLPRSEWKGFLGTSFIFSSPQIANALLGALPPVLLTMTAGPVSAAGFNVLQRLYSPWTQGAQLFIQPFWPAYSEAVRRSDTAWVTQAFRTTLAGTAAAVAGLAATAAVSGPVLRLWVGHESENVGHLLPAAVAVWFAVILIGQPSFHLLLGCGRLRRLATYGTAAPLIALGSVYLLGRSFEGAVALAGGAAAYALTMWGGLTWDTIGTLRPHPALMARMSGESSTGDERSEKGDAARPRNP